MIAANFHQIRKGLRTPGWRFVQLSLLPSFLVLTLLLTAARGQQTPPSAQPPPPAPPAPKADPAALRILSQAIEQLDPSKLGWFETRLQEQMYAQGLSFRTEGRYVCGPDHRLHLQLTVHLGDTDGLLQIISDGNTVWEEVHLGKGERFISKWNLKKVQETLNNPGTRPQIGEQFYRSRSFAGLVPLLQNLRDQLTFIKQEEAEWQKHKVRKLTGVWSAAVLKNLVPPGNPWPPLLPRTCQLYLGQEAPHWPYRLEWFGPIGPKGEDGLLLQMDFLNPQFTPAGDKPPARYDRLFSFDPGKTKVLDRTQQVAELVAVQIQNQPKSPAQR